MRYLPFIKLLTFALGTLFVSCSRNPPNETVTNYALLERIQSESPRTFGTSAAAFGGYFAIGDELSNEIADQAGAVYLYSFNEQGLSKRLHTFFNPRSDPRYGDFGWGLSMSEDFLAISAPQHGAVFVYKYKSNDPTIPFSIIKIPHKGSDQWFGRDVALSGSKLVVGASHDDTWGEGRGGVYIYDLDGSSTTNPVITLKNPCTEKSDIFGWRVAISGGILLVTARVYDVKNNYTHRILAYDLKADKPDQPFMEFDDPEGIDASGKRVFGRSFAIEGSTVAIGTEFRHGEEHDGSVSIFSLNSSKKSRPIKTIRGMADIHESLYPGTIKLQGSLVVIGDPLHQKVCMVSLSGKAPFSTSTIINPQPSANSQFGKSLTVDGELLIVGCPEVATKAPNSSAGYVYRRARNAQGMNGKN